MISSSSAYKKVQQKITRPVAYRHRCMWSLSEINTVINLVNSGMTQSEVAKVMQRSYNSIVNLSFNLRTKLPQDLAHDSKDTERSGHAVNNVVCGICFTLLSLSGVCMCP